MTAHVDAPQTFELALVPGDHLGESAVDIQSNDPHACAPPSLFVRSGSWRATRHLLIRAHGVSGKVARGGHVTSLGSRPTVYRRPARTFVLPAPRVPDGLTISPVPFWKQPDNEAPMISYRITASSS